MAAATAKGYRGKIVDLADYSNRHRTTLGHFLAEGKWDESVLQNKVKTESLRHVVQLSKQTTEPLFVIHDDTIAKKIGPRHRPYFPLSGPAFIIHI